MLHGTGKHEHQTPWQGGNIDNSLGPNFQSFNALPSKLYPAWIRAASAKKSTGALNSLSQALTETAHANCWELKTTFHTIMTATLNSLDYAGAAALPMSSNSWPSGVHRKKPSNRNNCNHAMAGKHVKPFARRTVVAKPTPGGMWV